MDRALARLDKGEHTFFLLAKTPEGYVAEGTRSGLHVPTFALQWKVAEETVKRNMAAFETLGLEIGCIQTSSRPPGVTEEFKRYWVHFYVHPENTMFKHWDNEPENAENPVHTKPFPEPSEPFESRSS